MTVTSFRLKGTSYCQFYVVLYYKIVHGIKLTIVIYMKEDMRDISPSFPLHIFSRYTKLIFILTKSSYAYLIYYLYITIIFVIFYAMFHKLISSHIININEERSVQVVWESIVPVCYTNNCIRPYVFKVSIIIITIMIYVKDHILANVQCDDNLHYAIP